MKKNQRTACKDCARWKHFKKECRYHWEDKQICTQWVSHLGSNEEYKDTRDPILKWVDQRRNKNV